MGIISDYIKSNNPHGTIPHAVGGTILSITTPEVARKLSEDNVASSYTVSVQTPYGIVHNVRVLTPTFMKMANLIPISDKCFIYNGDGEMESRYFQYDEPGSLLSQIVSAIASGVKDISAVSKSVAPARPYTYTPVSRVPSVGGNARKRAINLIVVHWFGGGSSYNLIGQNGYNTIKQIHVNQNGWSDVGYHYIIDRNGGVINGRPVSRAGAHALGYNTNSVGINMAYGTSDSDWTDASKNSLVSLLIQLCRKYNITPSRSVIKGHRELNSTACPGPFIMRDLDSIVLATQKGMQK